MRKLISFAILFVFIASMTGCATVVSGTSSLVNPHNRKIRVNTNPSGANVTIGDRTRTSPAEFALPKFNNGFLVKITKEGYNPVELDLQKSITGWLFLNIFFGPAMWLAFPIDFATGNAWKLSPTKFDVTLTPAEPTTKK